MVESGQRRIMPHAARWAVRLGVCLTLWGLGFSSAWGEDALDLFSPAPASPSARRTATAKAEYPLNLNFEALVSGAVVSNTLVRCEPEPGIFFTARVQRIETDVNGTLTLWAPLEGREFGHFSISVTEDQALGEILLPDEQRRYVIRFDAASGENVAGALTDEEVDELPSGPSIVPPLPDPAPADSGAGKKALPLSDLGNDGNTVIDLLIVYTPAAATWAGGTAGINNVIAQAMSRAQTAMDNSHIAITFRLVHSAQVTYTESGSSNTDVDRLQKTSDGYMDEVHTWRNQYGADVVSLMTTANDTGGLGYLLSSTGGMPTYAFNLTRVQQAATSYTVIHEIGHNMGAHHHKAQNVQPGPGLYSYAAGWRWTGTNGVRYCSVMSYDSGTYFSDGLTHTRVAYFSNPNVNHQGVASGNAADGDNARTLSNIRGVVAAYRAAASQPFWCTATPLNNRVLLRWEDPLECGFASKIVHIRSGSTNYPAATNQGTFVYQGTDDSFLHTNPVSKQPNYYTIWLSNDGSTFVEP